MGKITEKLEEEIPHGHWCHSGGKPCKYLMCRKPTLNSDGCVQGGYCNLFEECVTRKMCGINEGKADGR
jgi:hypothetical protein